MSLLMDALKKAEQEKKKAAEKHKQSADSDESAPAPAREQSVQQNTHTDVAKTPPAGSGLTLEPIQHRGEITDEFPIVDSGKQQTEEDSDLDISIDRMPADRGDEDEFEQTGKQPIPATRPAMADALRKELAEERTGGEGTFYGVELDGEETGRDMYEETLQGEPYIGKDQPHIYDETLPGVSAVELARDIGDENQPTPVAAQTIFAASASRRTASGFKWFTMVLASFIAIVIAIGVLFYQSEKITPVELPSPLVARGIEDIVPAQTLAQVQTEPVTGTLIQPQATSQPVTQGTVSPPSAPVPESTPATALQPVPEAPAVASGTAPTEAPTEAPTVIPAEVGRTLEPAITASPGTTVQQLLPAEIEVTHELFKISKSKGPDKNAAVVKAAYEDYQAGDYAKAKIKYEKIIKEFPYSRDGLLGLGAIAMYEHDRERAFEMYSQLLRIDPGNTVAKAALINLVGASGQVNSESAIKLMLHDNPRSSYLYFSLGNVYASKLRWAEAQQAYFDAYRYDSSNPNYALNLAIALDRMGQSETALDYYNTALKLASGKHTEFDEARVQARIDTISANIN